MWIFGLDVDLGRIWICDAWILERLRNIEFESIWFRSLDFGYEKFSNGGRRLKSKLLSSIQFHAVLDVKVIKSDMNMDELGPLVGTSNICLSQEDQIEFEIFE